MATTITIDDKKIEKKYSPYELKMQFLSFLRENEISDSVELYEIDVQETPREVQEAYKNIKHMKFIKR
jgi:hypothetical protein